MKLTCMGTELSKMYKIKAIGAKIVKLLKYPVDDKKEILKSLLGDNIENEGDYWRGRGETHADVGIGEIVRT